MSLWEEAQKRATSLDRKLVELTDEEWAELTERLARLHMQELEKRGYVVVRRSDWLYLGGLLD